MVGRGWGGAGGRVITLKEAETEYYWSPLFCRRVESGVPHGETALGLGLEQFPVWIWWELGLEYWWEEGNREAGKDL